MTDEQENLEEREEETTNETIEIEVTEEQIENLKQHQNFGFAFIGGLLVALLCAIVWAAITVATNYQIGYMAIAVGLLVGFSVRYFGLGIDKKFGILGACLALLGCVLGNLFSQVGYIANEGSYTYTEILSMLDFSLSLELLSESFHPMDILFYGFAIYEGYRFSFRKITPEALQNAHVAEGKKTRIILVVVALFVLVFAFVKVRQGYSGVKTYTYETGEKMSEGILENGKLQGEWTYYYQDGTIHSTGNYVQGTEHGAWVNYYENGAVYDSVDYIYGRLNGAYVSYYENGNIFQTGSYKNGRKEELWQSFYENGQPYTKGSFKNDEYIDKWVSYWEDGNIMDETVYVGDKAKLMTRTLENGEVLVKDGNGYYKAYSEDNKTLLLEGEYKDGEKTGTWKSYFSTGKLREEAIYESGVYKIWNVWNRDGIQTVENGSGKYVSYYEDKMIHETGSVENGLPTSIWVSRYPSGKKYTEVMYKEGKQHGKTVQYYESGDISLTGEYLDDKGEGEWIWYHSNGIVSSSATFKNGLKEGEQTFYDETGTLLRKETYKNGELVDVEIS